MPNEKHSYQKEKFILLFSKSGKLLDMNPKSNKPKMGLPIEVHIGNISYFHFRIENKTAHSQIT